MGLRECWLSVVPGAPHRGQVIRLERETEPGHQRLYSFYYVVSPVLLSGRQNK